MGVVMVRVRGSTVVMVRMRGSTVVMMRLVCAGGHSQTLVNGISNKLGLYSNFNLAIHVQ